MEDVQKNVNRAFAAKDAYLKACLQDWRNCNKPSELVTGFNDNIDDQSDAATYGITAHPWVADTPPPAVLFDVGALTCVIPRPGEPRQALSQVLWSCSS